MLRFLWSGCLALVLVVSGAAETYGQATASISGVVRDSGGGVVPGAAVVVKEDATARTHETITTGEGRFSVTALLAGSYTVTAALAGFKTAEAKGIRVAPGQPVTIPLTLEVGSLTDTVTVTSSAELINTETATVAATLNSDQLTRMPTPTRNALNAVAFLPGVNTPGANRDSTINGLPEGFYSITLDGVSNNDNFLRNTDGFFASITPRQDAVEAVSITLAAAGASVGGAASGAVTMAFQTRSGGNRFTGSAYEYWRDPSLNSNYYFNTINNQKKNQVGLNQFGARVGGPVVIPGLYDGRSKAFFFFHYEQIRFPNSFTRTRTIYNKDAADGWFAFQASSCTAPAVSAGGGNCRVNLLDIARANGQVSVKDPTMASLLKSINEVAGQQGTRNPLDPVQDSYVWQSPSQLFEHQPTVRGDYNLGTSHRISGSFSVITAKRTPDYLNSADPRFPNSPNHRDFSSTRPILSLTLRSILSKDITNELRGGLSAFYGQSNFGYPSSVTDSGNSVKSFEDQGGFAIVWPGSISNWYTSNTPSWRFAPTYSIDDTVTWVKKDHTLNLGGNFLISNAESDGQQIVPYAYLGFETASDPADFMFASNISGIPSTNQSAAKQLYAVLTGRITSLNSAAVINPDTGKYQELYPTIYPGGIKQLGFFLQDSWRVSPTLTLTGGLRWDVQLPFVPTTSTMSTVTMDSICGVSGLGAGGLYSKCQFNKPGSTGGKYPEYIQLKKGTEGYNTDWNNFAPSASVAWRPNVQSGFLRTLLGDPDQATLRGGYSVAYERQGLTVFTSLYGGNAGLSIPLIRNSSSGFTPPGEKWPVLLSQKDRLTSAPFNPDPSYPILARAGRVDNLNAFAPDIQIARVQNWTVGFARSISKDTAVEIRYVGNKGSNQWSGLNYNTIRTENLLGNGFFDEFKLAAANLTANNTAGGTRAGSFAYFGPGTGTNPLPIYLAYLNGRSDATNAAAYTGGSSTFSSTSLAGRLVRTNADPTRAASDLDGSSTRRANAAKVGYPADFFVLNPDVGQANVTDSGAFSDYHALQVELRRRLSKGLSANVNYQYAFREGGSIFDGFMFGRTNTPTANVRHAIKFQADWTVPVGRGQRFGADMSKALDALAGGWSINAVGRTQTVLQDFGNVRLVGMTKDELQSMYKYYYRPNPTTGLTEVWMLPEDVILNTRRAYSTSTSTVDGYSSAATSLGPPQGKYIAPANSDGCVQVRPGDCAPRSIQLLAPWFFRLDFGVTKRIPIHGRMNVELRFDMLNLLDNINFNPVSNPGSGTDIFKVTSAYTDASNTYDPGGRIGQLMFRFNW